MRPHDVTRNTHENEKEDYKIRAMTPAISSLCNHDQCMSAAKMIELRINRGRDSNRLSELVTLPSVLTSHAPSIYNAGKEHTSLNAICTLGEKQKRAKLIILRQNFTRLL